MKLATAPQNVSVHGDFHVTDFNVGDIAFIVDMFADKVYSHKERAVIRELSCNAYDSHIMARTTDVPFKIHLPTLLEPFFSVRDFGTGLSDGEVRSIFAGIGISTKRNSNEMVGCFGIGSLSPYALADNFTVTSYYNHVKRIYSCYRDEQRKPVVAMLSESETDEPNGLEVNVSVDTTRIRQFEKEAEYVFKFWEGIMPEINNNNIVKNCAEHNNQYILKTDNFGIIPEWGNMVAVMGNIAYNIPSSLSKFNCSGYLRFEIGELDFDTARENLSLTEKTKQVLENRYSEVKNSVNTIIIDRIKSLPTDFEKAKFIQDFSSSCIRDIIDYKLQSEYALPKLKESAVRWSDSGKLLTKNIPIGKNVKYYIHKDRMGSRIKSYVKDSNCQLFIFNDKGQFKESKVPVELLCDLEDLPKVQRESTSNSRYKVINSYIFNQHHRYYGDPMWKEYDVSQNSSSSEIVYVELQRLAPVACSKFDSSDRMILNTLSTLKLVGIAIPKIIGLKSSFCKTKNFKNGNFIHFSSYVLREAQKLGPQQIYSYVQGDIKKINTLNSLFDMDELKEIKELMGDIHNYEEYQTMSSFYSDCGLKITLDTSLQDKIDNFFESYEMLKILDTWEFENHKTIVAKYLGAKLLK